MRFLRRRIEQLHHTIAGFIECLGCLLEADQAGAVVASLGLDKAE